MPDKTIYPSSWYYNASVQGFMEVLAHGLGEEAVSDFFRDDGTIVIPSDVIEAVYATNKNKPLPISYLKTAITLPHYVIVNEMKRISWWWVDKSKKTGPADCETIIKETCKSMLGTNKTFYPNLKAHNEGTPNINFLNEWFSFSGQGKLKCSLCNSNCTLGTNSKDSFAYLTQSIASFIGNSAAKFPNSLWDNTHNLLICPFCRSQFICFHLAHKNKSFINTGSFKVNWHLNRLIWDQTKIKYSYQQALLSAIPFSRQLRGAISSWSLQSMELLEFGGNNIVNYYPLSTNQAELLLIPAVSSNLGKLRNKHIWKTFLKENYDYLPAIAYKNIVCYLKGSNPQEDPEVFVRNDIYARSGIDAFLSLILAINLYFKGKQGGKKVASINYYKIRQEAGEAPFSLDENPTKNMVYRVLELARLNKKNEVYHILMRSYIAHGKKFPTVVAHLFEIEDENLFKTGIYCFVSGLRFNLGAADSALKK